MLPLTIVPLHTLENRIGAQETFQAWAIRVQQVLIVVNQRMGIVSPALRPAENHRWWGTNLYAIMRQTVNLFLQQTGPHYDGMTVSRLAALGFHQVSDLWLATNRLSMLIILSENFWLWETAFCLQ